MLAAKALFSAGQHAHNSEKSLSIFYLRRRKLPYVKQNHMPEISVMDILSQGVKNDLEIAVQSLGILLTYPKD